jgi:mRNA-degrading endonuclease toxin of MazEF toxin-antitoxin module
LDKNRPGLIVSNDSLNRHALDVCVVPLTSVHHERFALRVAIPAGDGGIARGSWAKCDQVATVNKQAIVYPPLGRLSAATLRGVEDGIRLALDLP